MREKTSSGSSTLSLDGAPVPRPAALAAVGLGAGLVWWWLGRAPSVLGLSVPLWYHELPLPILYWVAVGFYVVWAKWALALSWSWAWARGLLLGVVGHLFLQLVALATVLQGPTPLGQPYRLYILALVVLAAMTLGAWSGRLLRLLRSSSGGDFEGSLWMKLPLVVLWVASLPALLVWMPWAMASGALGFAWGLLDEGGPVGKLAGSMRRALSWLAEERRFIVFLFLLAFVVRLAFGARLLSLTGEGFPLASDDGPTYHRFALLVTEAWGNIFNGKIDPKMLFGPFYWFFLGLVYSLAGPSFLVVVALQSALGALVPVFSAKAARRIFGPAVGYLTGLLVALNFGLIHLSVVLGVEALYIPLLMGAFLALVRYGQVGGSGSTWLLLSIGFALGIAAIVRSIILLLPIFLGAWLIWARRGVSPLTVRLRDLGLIMLTMGLMVAPVTLRNWKMSGQVVLVTRQGPVMWDVGKGPHDPGNKSLTEMGVSPRFGLVASINAIAAQPGQFLLRASRLATVRSWKFYTSRYFGFFDPLSLTNPAKFFTGFSVSFVLYQYVAFLVGLAALFWRRFCPAGRWLMAVFIGYYTLFHPVLFYVRNVRYRMPINALLVMIAALGLVVIYEWFAEDVVVEA